MTTTTEHHHETRITADPNTPTIVITREFDAPPERVFLAHTDPDLLVRWLACMRMRTLVDRYDARTGGSYRYRNVEPDGTEYGFYGSFHEVRLPERIVQTFTFEGFPDSVSLETLTFEDLGGRTRLTTTSVVDSFEARDGMLASGMADGVREGYEQLDELLAADA